MSFCIQGQALQGRIHGDDFQGCWSKMMTKPLYLWKKNPVYNHPCAYSPEKKMCSQN